MMPPFLGLGGHGRAAPLDPPVEASGMDYADFVSDAQSTRIRSNSGLSIVQFVRSEYLPSRHVNANIAWVF